MKLWVALRDASRGWAAIILRRQDWRERFRLSGAGLATALLIYFFLGFLAIAFGPIGTGTPDLAVVIVGLIVQGLSIAALAIAVYLTRMALKSNAHVLGFIVPGIYALIFFLVAGSILAIIGSAMIVLALLALAYLLYRLARMAGEWSIGVSVAFAVFTVVLLVGMPPTLYMLSNPAGSPI